MIYWLVIRAPPPPPRRFLTDAELKQLATFRFPKRRREWLLGRLAAKRLLQSVSQYEALSTREITVGNDPDGAPYLAVSGGERVPLSLSISHRDDLAFCALAARPGPTVGADVERVERRAASFVRDFFTTREVETVNRSSPQTRDLWVTVIWSAKEAVLKALRLGLTVDTRHVEILPTGARGEGWRPLTVSCTLPEAPPMRSWWRPWGDHVLTLAATGDLKPMPFSPR